MNAMEFAKNFLIETWGEDGFKVIAVCEAAEPFNNGIGFFLDHCTACGGNWGGMILTGIKELYPDVWDAIPEEMTDKAWVCLCQVLVLLHVRIM